MAHNVDDILVLGREALQPAPVIEEKEKPEKVKSEVQKEIDPEREEKYRLAKEEEEKQPKQMSEFDQQKAEHEAKQKEKPEVKEEKEEVEEEVNDDSDEYGNPVPKAKTYTEEEVQRMIRDRLSRGNHQQQPMQPQQAAKAAGDFEFDENSNVGWQEQLEQFVEKTYNKIEGKKAARAHEEREQRAKAEFESKFVAGMAKYGDFVETLSDKTVTDAMVMATRSMADPAAFLYAAAKKFPQELNRISQLPDIYAQATEIGRLEERMKKAKAATRSSRPLESDKGDYNHKPDTGRQSIESLIERHALSKRR